MACLHKVFDFLNAKLVNAMHNIYWSVLSHDWNRFCLDSVSLLRATSETSWYSLCNFATKYDWNRLSGILSHWGRLKHICPDNFNHHWFRYRLVACGVKPLPKPMLKYCWLEPQKQTSGKCSQCIIFIQENAYENVICEMAAILYQPQCVNIFVTCILWYIP